MESTLSPNPPGRPKLIVVLGMHRSGTSVATRAMETLGAAFGDNLMPAASNNPKGFFEDLDIVQLNMDLLLAVGVDWHALPAPDLSHLSREELDSYRARALALLRQKCQSGTLALKDPRIARLIPFWQPVFDQFAAQVLYAVAFRHPISVARSLEARNQIPAEKSYLLWLAHVVPALRHTANLQRTLINYDSMMEAPQETLARLASELDLPLDPTRREVFKRDFLEDSLRHTRSNGTDLERAENMPEVVKALFAALASFADGPSPAARHRLDDVLTEAEAFLANAAPLMAHGWGIEVRLNKTLQRVGELEHCSNTQCARLTELERSLADANAQLEAIEQRPTEYEDIRRSMQATIDSLEQARRTQDAAMRTQQTELSTVLTSKSWRVTAPLRTARGLFSHCCKRLRRSATSCSI